MDPLAAAGALLGALAAGLAGWTFRARIGAALLSLPGTAGLRARWAAMAAALSLPPDDPACRAGLGAVLAAGGLLLLPFGPLGPTAALLAAALPFLALERAWAERALRMEAELPWILDFLAMGVRAGLDFEVALERAARLNPGPLAEEIQETLSAVRVGTPRAEALRRWGERSGLPAVQAFTGVLAQADATGGSLGGILKVQADAARSARLRRAELAAQKAPVKLLFPLVVCIFPVTFLVLFGPLLHSVLS